jgi:hypothetical protein
MLIFIYEDVVLNSQFSERTMIKRYSIIESDHYRYTLVF